MNEKTTLRNYDFRKQIIDASPFPGEWLRNATPYFLLGNTDYKNLLWILKDSNGNEIVRKELGNQTHYTHDNDLDAGKTYFWDLYSRSDTGEIEASIENRQFQIKDPTIPQLTSPVQCEGKTYKHKLYIGWKTGTIPVEKWRVTIRQNERSEVFITKEYDINQLYDIVIIPSHYESCVVEFSYYSNNEWVSETSEIDLELIDLNIEILTPTENSQIADSNLTTRFRISGSDSKYINENSLRVQLIHNNKSIFDSDSCITDFKVLENGEFSYTIGVVPSNSENIDLVISGYLHDSFDGYPARHNPNSELSNPFDYFESRRSITCANKPESVSGYEYKSGNYNWIDATVGVKIPLKGKLDIINQHRQHWYADIETPFPIEFYGASYNSVRIMERGIISFSHAFEPGETDFTAHMLNADYPNNVIAPFPGNLSLRNGGGIYHHTIGESPDRKFIIQWNQMNNYNDESEGAYTFQLVFTENSDDIMFQYKDVDISSTQYHIPSHYDFGAFSIIGLKNQDGTKSTIYSIKSSVVNNEEAILFTPL